MSIYDNFNEEQLRILQERAERAAGMMEDEKTAAMTALLITIRGEKYALPIDAIRNVYQEAVITPVPCVPAYIAGMANVRGYLVPVIDLAILLGVPGADAAATGHLIYAADDECSVAFLVEQIGEVVSLPVDRLMPVPATSSIKRLDYLSGMLPDGTVVLDVAAILGDPAMVVDEKPA